MIKACIIDDEANSREVMALMLGENHPDVEIVAACGNITDGLDAILRTQPDVLFLDIEMPGGTGFELLRQLPAPVPEVIFCTAYGHYAIKAIECSALAYLLKPISSEKLHAAMEKVRHSSSPLQKGLQHQVLQEQLNPGKSPSRFLLNTVDEIKVIRFDDVVCCIAESNYTNIYMADGSKIMASKTLKEFEHILHKPHFFRIHHSYLINLHYVQRISKVDGCIVELTHGLALDVARTRREEFLHRITEV